MCQNFQVYTRTLHGVKFSKHNDMRNKQVLQTLNEHQNSEHSLIKENNNITKNKNYNRGLMQSEDVTPFFIRETFYRQDFFT